MRPHRSICGTLFGREVGPGLDFFSLLPAGPTRVLFRENKSMARKNGLENCDVFFINFHKIKL